MKRASDKSAAKKRPASESAEALARRVRKSRDRVIVRSGGKPAAAMVPIEDLRLIEAIEDQQDAEEVERIRKTAKPEDFLPLSALKVARGR